ncbi:MAG: mechanosensitive ion channel family protein [Nitrospiraceae bacterium]
MKEFWEKALLAPLETLSREVLAVLPNVLAMSIILLVGLVAAWSIGHVVERLLRVIGLDLLSNRLGVSAALARGGVKTDPSHLIGRAAYWLVVAFSIMAGLGALNLQPLNQFAQSFLAYLPRLFTAALILVVGYLLSNFVSQAVLIAAVNAGIPPARIVAACSRWGVQLVAVAMALEQLGIAQNIVTEGFGIVLGGVVLAGAIAFGLGAKDLAKEFLERRLGNKPRERAPDDLRHL